MYNLLPFELVVLPLWFERFVVNESQGIFSYQPHAKSGELYGSIDVVHVYYATGRLEMNEIWAARIQEYQNESGWFLPKDPDQAPGWQPWHGSASATAALRLLKAQALRPNLAVEALAWNGREEWSATFDPLYASACYKETLAGNNIHKCGQRIGSYASILTNTSAPMLEWWVDWLRNKTEPDFGVLCPVSNSTLALVECIGGAQPTHGVELGLELVQELPFAQSLLDFALHVQNLTGGAWSDTDDSSELGSLSLDGIFQVTRAALQLNTPDALLRARKSCQWFLDLAVPQLNEPRIVFSKYASTSHDLPNILFAVAQCAQTFPSLGVRTLKPWTCCPVYV